MIAVREENYIEAARSLGATSPRLIRRHVVPNVASPVIIQLSLSLGFALLTEAGLNYLGIGEQPPTPSWGAMMNEGYSFIFTTPWALVFPGLTIMLSVLSFNLVADGLRDSLGRERPASSSPVGGERGTRVSRLAQLRGISPRADRPSATAPVATQNPDGSLLSVKNLSVEFLTNRQWLPVMEDASFTVSSGERPWAWSVRAGRARRCRPWP